MAEKNKPILEAMQSVFIFYMFLPVESFIWNIPFWYSITWIKFVFMLKDHGAVAAVYLSPK